LDTALVRKRGCKGGKNGTRGSFGCRFPENMTAETGHAGVCGRKRGKQGGEKEGNDLKIKKDSLLNPSQNYFICVAHRTTQGGVQEAEKFLGKRYSKRCRETCVINRLFTQLSRL